MEMGSVANNVREEGEVEKGGYNPSDAVLFFGISLVLGIASRHLFRGTRVPYTVALLVLGITMGSLEYGTSHRLGKVGGGIRIWANIDPDLLGAALIFQSVFSMEVHQIKKCMAQMVILAVPGVLLSTCILGAALKLIFPYNWSWKTSLLLGGLLSPTDPVAVVALLKELGASKKLRTIIEGESLMNEWTAVVVYTLFFRMVTGSTFGWVAVIKFLASVSLGAVATGIAFGLVAYLWLGFIFDDTVIKITLILAVTYLAYFVSQEVGDISGLLTVMTLGFFYAANASTAFKGEGQFQSLHHFWEMVSYIANTLIFILSGVVIAEGILGGDSIFKHEESAWGYLILLYVLLQLSRAIVVGSLYPLLRYFGYGLDWKEAIVLVWSGVRGAAALFLSLLVKQSSDSSPWINHETGMLFVFFTSGIVFLTLIVNGSTTRFVLRMLDMDKLSPAKRRMLDFTKYEMTSKALKAFGDLLDDEELGPADWRTVKKYITCLHDAEGERIHPYTAIENDNDVEHMHLSDIRIQFLNGVQAAYCVMLKEGRITQYTANILVQSVDEALDLFSSKPLCDWNGLKLNVRFPNYYKFLPSIFPRKLATYFTVQRLESACYICDAFLRAHRIARKQLHDFIGDNEIALAIINESEIEGEAAKKFLEDVRITFPQVLRVLKSRQVAYSVLNRLSEYVQYREKSGLLKKEELVHLRDVIQTDLKKLLLNPPIVRIPEPHDLISANRLLGALPSAVRERIVGSSKVNMKQPGVTLYSEGSKPNGIWLISNGVVKWASKKIRNKHSLHPTFAHGSTLGLYEVLLGKPYICDIVTDSVVYGFFIEAERILSVLGTDHAVEDFLWQESSVILSKLLLPQIFEKMTMHDLRTLVAERSTMSTYITGECFEITQHKIALLLEGLIKTHGALELITAPAALFRVSKIAVETRARVIMFDIAGFKTSRTQRRTSLISHGGDNPPRTPINRA